MLENFSGVGYGAVAAIVFLLSCWRCPKIYCDEVPIDGPFEVLIHVMIAMAWPLYFVYLPLKLMWKAFQWLRAHAPDHGPSKSPFNDLGGGDTGGCGV